MTVCRVCERLRRVQSCVRRTITQRQTLLYLIVVRDLTSYSCTYTTATTQVQRVQRDRRTAYNFYIFCFDSELKLKLEIRVIIPSFYRATQLC